MCYCFSIDYKILGFPGSDFDDIVEEDEHLSNDAEDDMADFIEDEEVIYGKSDSLRYVAINMNAYEFTGSFSIGSLF